MVIKPLFGNILIQIEEKEETGIVLGEKSFNDLLRAKVIELGDGEMTPYCGGGTGSGGGSSFTITPIPLKKFSYIYFYKNDAKPITIDGKEMYILNWRSVYAKEE
jgi:co-chaperonin GroES (HSP10)